MTIHSFAPERAALAELGQAATRYTANWSVVTRVFPDILEKLAPPWGPYTPAVVGGIVQRLLTALPKPAAAAEVELVEVAVYAFKRFG
jgi:hypothetical protein